MENIKEKVKINDFVSENKMPSFIQFLVNNDWFGIEPTLENDGVYIKQDEYKAIKKRVDFFLQNHNKSLLSRFEEVSKNFLPKKTSEMLKKYIKKKQIDEQTAYNIADFLSSSLPGEILLCDNKEINDLLMCGGSELNKSGRVVLCDFLKWIQSNYKACYTLQFKATSTYKIRTDAYDEEEWLRMLFLLFNFDNIKNNKMIEKACLYKEYVDTWLYLSLHFICALRSNDMERIPDPTLNDTPDNIIHKIMSGAFTKADSLSVLNSIMIKLNYYDYRPNKTKNTTVASKLMLHIPTSLEEHFGKLFAIAEAHKIRTYSNPDLFSLIIPIKSYKDISKNMGEEIGELFRECDFSSRRANKSYLQMIEIMTDKVLDKDTLNTKGYILASLARSHKGSYGEFAKSTSIYLKDSKMNGLSPSKVAKELFERKPLSFAVSMMLKIVTNNEYNQLSLHDQTKLISVSNLTPSEINTIAGLTDQSLKKAAKVVAEIYKEKIDVKDVLYNISCHSSAGKTSDCLLIASNKMCPFADRKTCIGCDYEVKTKSTLYVMAYELKRLKKDYMETKNRYEKEKIHSIMTNNILPSINEMYICLKNLYGEEEAEAFERMLHD